jgi:hypothetical protein
LTKATWNFKPSPPSLSRKEKKTFFFFSSTRKKRKKEKKEMKKVGKKRTQSGRRERIPLAPVFGYGSADGNNTRNSKLGSLFVIS